MIMLESLLLLSLQTYNMATSTIGDMPLTHPEVEKYFTRLAFYIEASQGSQSRQQSCTLIQLWSTSIFADRNLACTNRYHG